LLSALSFFIAVAVGMRVVVVTVVGSHGLWLRFRLWLLFAWLYVLAVTNQAGAVLHPVTITFDDFKR
jgi:hypothetical protein